MSVQGSAGTQILNNNNQMMAIISKSMQQQQELAEKMIKLSLEQKTNQGKNQLLGKIVDLTM